MEGQTLKIVLDTTADAAMVYLTDDEGVTVARTAFCEVELVNAAVILRFDPDDRLLGLEILGASRLLPAGVLARAEKDA